MENVFYFLSSCDRCRKLMKTLELPAFIKQVDIKNNPLSFDELKDLSAHTNSYIELVNTRAQLLKQENIKIKTLEEEEILKLLNHQYTLLIRPILVYKGMIFKGSNKDTWEQAKKMLVNE